MSIAAASNMAYTVLSAITLPGLDDRSLGKIAFAAVFAILILWIAFMPAARLGQSQGRPPFWKNVRVWAIFVAATQMMVYLLWP